MLAAHSKSHIMAGFADGEHIYGKNINNQGYTDIVKLGEGEFGIVFQAKKGEELYAIKCEKPVLLLDKEKVKAIEERRRSEKKNFDEIVKGKLKHPNIVQYFLYFIGSLPEYNNLEVSFIVMELCKCSLKQWFKDNPRNREYQICFKMFNGIANGLKYIHDNGIIHRDLKPGNILISNDDICKIADFRFSKNAFDDSTFTRSNGTPPYAAPELTNENSYDCKVDIYSLGLIFTEFFSELNYNNKEWEKVLKKVRKRILPENFFNRNPDCNTIEKAKELVLRMTLESPNDRPLMEEIISEYHHRIMI